MLSGLAAGLLGLLGLGYALLGPTGRYVRSSATPGGPVIRTTGTTSLLETQGLPPFIVIMAIGVIGVAAAAVLDTQQPSRISLALLWGLSLLVVGGAALSLLSIGLFLLPAALLALIAAFLGSARLAREGRA
jgi:hypothetical protein